MGKFRLDLTDLNVQTFTAGTQRGPGRGTVQAREDLSGSITCGGNTCDGNVTCSQAGCFYESYPDYSCAAGCDGGGGGSASCFCDGTFLASTC
jgi:hypothetical protein